MTVPFSPALVAGMVFPPVATPFVGHTAQAFATRLWKRHRKNFDRLKDYESTRFLIDPIDLPLSFILEMAPEGPILEVLRNGDDGDEDKPVGAVIRGSIQALLDMAQGKVDGDALFFSRDLKVEGDTEAVVALRNAVDDADIDFLEEIISAFGPLARPAAAIAERTAALATRLIEDFDGLQQAILGPLIRRVDAHEETIEVLEKQVAALELKLKKQAERAKAQEKKANHGKT